MLDAPTQGPDQLSGGAGRLRLVGETLGQVAFDVFQDEVRPPLVLADLVELDDVGVAQPGHRHRFAVEARPVARVGTACVEQHLQGHHPLDAGVLGPEDHPMPPDPTTSCTRYGPSRPISSVSPGGSRNA